MTAVAWANLADRLRQRYPDDWAERFAQHKNGTLDDLVKWRRLGGATLSEARKLGVDPSPSARYARILKASRDGVPAVLLAERFGMTPNGIRTVLARFGERAQR